MKVDTIKNELLEKVFASEKVSTKMAEFYKKEWYDTVIKLNDNEYYNISKPRIETSFCFGFGYCGVTTQEDMERAGELADKARKSQERFIEENLKRFNSELATLKYHLLCLDSFEKAEEYYNKNNNLIRYADKVRVPVLYHCRNERPFELALEYTDRYNADTNEFVKRIATKDDLKKLISAYETAREKFAKRLNTYLKRYGLTKLNVWTYLVD